MPRADLLISAVPLYAVDWRAPLNLENPTAPSFERCWFSDGGLCSNFPTGLFDSPIPTRPVFAIDLNSFPKWQNEDTTDESANVWTPVSNSDINVNYEMWTRFGEAKPDLSGFFGAILNAMQNWQDNTLSRIHGFSEGIVHVYLTDDQGGPNLTMRSEVLTRLAARGAPWQPPTTRDDSDSGIFLRKKCPFRSSSVVSGCAAVSLSTPVGAITKKPVVLKTLTRSAARRGLPSKSRVNPLKTAAGRFGQRCAIPS